MESSVDTEDTKSEKEDTSGSKTQRPERRPI